MARRVLMPMALCALAMLVAISQVARLFGTSEASDSPTFVNAVVRHRPSQRDVRMMADDEGLFAPVVKGAKTVMGEKQLKKVRAEVIKAHGSAINTFVDKGVEFPWGKIVLTKMFEYADADKSGYLDKEEIVEACKKLGFTWMDAEDEKDINKIMKKADKNKDDQVDFDEFLEAAPAQLKLNLTKLAKENGHALGFLV